ncbi:uncharacterized protein LOC143201707 [Rhynchophorus ferrugineus]|uniref:uncharacterized protein LOC143201707 n=1 Tax=Rhynchophorus ferrugineus TaxID=354439 RepID=UPI003FCCBBE8
MDINLDSHVDFTEEQEFLESVAKKKVELEKERANREQEFAMRFEVIKGYFSRLSWRHKRGFFLSVISQCSSMTMLVRILSYVTISYEKLAAYADVKPHCTLELDQILMDHDRTLENNCLRDSGKQDLEWIASLTKEKQQEMLLQLLIVGGRGLTRKLYIPLLSLYNRRVQEQQLLRTGELNTEANLEELLQSNEFDDIDKYPQDHAMSLEVTKLRKKWDEGIQKYREEIFAASKTALDAKGRKQDKKETARKNKGKNADKDDISDWISILPIWITKKIFAHFDNKTLQSFKKINVYWSYVCDGVIKDRQARKSIDETVEKLMKNVDLDVLKQCEAEEPSIPMPRIINPGERKLKKLWTRGATIDKIRPKIRQSEQAQFSGIASGIPAEDSSSKALNIVKTFPRMIKEDLLMYKEYPCLMKDVNILINVEADIKQQRETLSYSLSRSLKDTFSMSQITLSDW